jgi:catechol 2,3-dioxygenase-like lactoylglutathione lyase family enzyme
MPSRINISSIFVLDQDEALDFYVGKLGLEVSADFDLGFMRWLTVRAPGDDGREILLELPGAPAHDPATTEQIRELVSKGAMGFTAGLVVEDVRAEHARLSALGVEFTDEPTDRFYGTDCGLRDPFGNNLRLLQPAAAPTEFPGAEAFAD